MTDMKAIVVTVDEDGQIRTDLSGFSGPGCIHEAEAILEALKSLGVELDLEAFTAKRPGMETHGHRVAVRHRAGD